MGLDLKKLKARLAKAQTKGGGKFYKPEDGDQTIRIVSGEDGDPFKDYWFHYGVGKNQGFLCPKKNYGEECPVCDFATKLWKDDQEDGKVMAKKLFARQRFFAPILVRGKEDQKILVWSFGKTVYENLIKLCLNPEYGDITDVEKGTDLDMSYGTPPGASFPKTTLQPKRSESKLCADLTKKECEELLKTTPDIEGLMDRKTTKECEALLNDWLADDADVPTGETKKYGGSDEAKESDGTEDPIDKEFSDLLDKK